MSTLSPRPEAIVDALPCARDKRPPASRPSSPPKMAPDGGTDPPKPLGSALTSTNTEP